jgi:hypothetical protein
MNYAANPLHDIMVGLSLERLAALTPRRVGASVTGRDCVVCHEPIVMGEYYGSGATVAHYICVRVELAKWREMRDKR